jgi:hypothetical protein
MHSLSALEGTRHTLNDSNLPDGHTSYEQVCMALTCQCRRSRNRFFRRKVLAV